MTRAPAHQPARRPDPEALLEQARAEEARRARGALKVFFGAAPGVGKTYAMLEAARELRANGVDVVVGYVETHGRPETEALLAGLELLPPRRVEYRGTTLRDFDLDAALARRPTVVVVDELAHSNAPGARHAKRWQDVVELLGAGIGVYTTMNVQHIESLNDVVAQITGARVRETVPDSVLEQADEVELVDLPPDDLLQRLKDGKVYVPDLAAHAIEHFFRKGNLIALRELALRQTADRVDAQMRGYMREHAVPTTWPVTERLLVGIGPSPYSARLVRAAKRMADRLHAGWIAAYVETPAVRRLPAEARERAVQTLRLAEQLGAETVTLSGARMSDEILACARARNVTKIVVGKPARSLWKRILLGSIVDALVEGSGEIDVYVISGEPEAPSPARIGPARPPAVDWRAYGWAAATVALCTAVAWVVLGRFERANLVMVYLLGVVAVAVRFGRGPAVAASVLSVAAFDFFFVTPYLTFAVSDTQYLVTFAVMLVVALVISGLTVQARAQAQAAREREQRTGALYRLSRELAGSRDVEQLARTALRHIAEVVPGRTAVLLPEAAGRLEVRAAEPPGFVVDGNEGAVAQWVYAHNQPAGRGTATLPGAQALYLPLTASRGAVGVLGVQPTERQGWDTPEQLHLLETFANQTALAIERASLAAEAHDAQVRVATERVRSSLLGSVSHDLRTPLATITGASSSALDALEQLDRPTLRELLGSINREAERLNRLVQNVLEMTRLATGDVTVHKEWQSLEGLVGAALARLEKDLREHPVAVRLPPDLPLVPVDGVLLDQVLVNLLDNAIKYAPPGSPIDISAARTGQGVTVEVADRGPGLPPGAEERVFEKFYRGPVSGTRGVGLGLAICRAVVEAHGGRIWAEARPDGGAVFRFTLPLDGPPPEIRPGDA